MSGKGKDGLENTLPSDEKRIPKCPGCKTPHTLHSWAEPGPHCTGKGDALPENMPQSTGQQQVDNLDLMAVHEPELVPDEEEELTGKLQELMLREEALAKKKRVATLKQQISDAEKRISTLMDSPAKTTGKAYTTESTKNPPTPLAAVIAGSAGTQNGGTDLQNRLPAGSLDLLLAGYAGNSPNIQQQQINSNSASIFTGNPDGPLSGPLASQESAMFLKPAQLAKGERVLRIIDYVDKIVTSTEDKTITDLGSTKLVISSGPKKPKLESLSISQWVVGNTRIFHTLLSSGKLPSPQDVQHYLAYTVKIMELSTKFSWPSVLQYDDEFRHIQAVYNYPWSFDSHHLHTVTLEPLTITRKPSGGKPSLGVAPANFSADGRVICRNFNRTKGCTLHECHFAHVCNRQINGRACGQVHPSHSHPGGRGTVQGQGGPTTSN